MGGIAGDAGDKRPRQHHAHHGAGATEHQALRQQRAPQRPGAGAERRAHDQLAFPAHRAGENQVGHVRARDEEHDRGRGEQHEQDRPRRRRDLIAKPRHPELDVGARRIRLGVLTQHGRMHGCQLGARRLERGPGRESAEQLRHPVAPVGDHRGAQVVRAGHHVRDDLGVGRIGHRRFEDADHRGGARTEADRLADHGRIAVERGRPEPVRQDRRPGRLGPIVARVQQPAEHRAKAHHVEERPVHDARLHHAGLAAEANHREVDRGEITEGPDSRDP